MVKHIPDFKLFIFAFDDRAFKILTALKLKNTVIISLTDFEDPQLLAVKPERSIAEYCWTSTSSTVLFVLNKYGVDNCTYIDSDICFYANPQPIFDEMGSNSILLTEHRYSPKYNKEVKSGRYCVQFVTFKNDDKGITALKWWRERCLEWCFNRYEDGKFGDQLYLDDWTERFEGVFVMKVLGGGLAAWNVQQYNFSSDSGKIIGTEISSAKEFDAIFYHYHYLRFFNDGNVELGRRILSESVLNIFYKPYIARLNEIKIEINKNYPDFDPNGARENRFQWKTPVIYLYRKLAGVYNVFDVNSFLRN
jgi:hypothetical protein